MQVFVYGTLTDPERVDAVLGASGAAVAGSATLEGLHRVEGRYPTLAPGGCVDGRLLSVDRSGLERLDRYEGVDDGLYVRIAVARADGGRVWTYVGDPDRLEVDAPVDWPAGSSLRDRVRRHVTRPDVVVRCPE
ncbi:gamma-glutamylcyclotransferase family protein [Halopiger djelfimassiliensis]|uniref:gamma-glutamylcyclotransferase family protein n=1 Tax=Halopiger djelfimassiliensis TaxID=1293047 RepID=UPI000678054D|nr:gamma-glutamylcyclotransferase family protein [Halopiger djelfimassiliensis]